MDILACILAFAFCFLAVYAYSLKQDVKKTVKFNAKQAEENKQLEQTANDLKNTIENLTLETSKVKSELKDKQDSLLYISDQIIHSEKQQKDLVNDQAERLRIAGQAEKEKLQREYEDYREELRSKLENFKDEISLKQTSIQSAIKEEESKLAELRAKQDTYLQEQQRKEEMLRKKDYYRLCISDAEIADVQALRNFQSTFSRKEAIDKILWDIYYKPAFDVLSSHLFEGTGKVCGIYKITCLDIDKAYIGQSVDIRERWRQHIKSALSHESTQNKLYKGMKEYGVHNFTFEILEEVPRTKLNEREVYWIDFYRTQDFGFNGNKGGS